MFESIGVIGFIPFWETNERERVLSRVSFSKRTNQFQIITSCSENCLDKLIQKLHSNKTGKIFESNWIYGLIEYIFVTVNQESI